jgi:hypothetical protein
LLIAPLWPKLSSSAGDFLGDEADSGVEFLIASDSAAAPKAAVGAVMSENPTHTWPSERPPPAPVEPLVAQFRGVWQSGPPPNLDDYLLRAGDQRGRVHNDLVLADLEGRLRAGELVRVESYLERYPELADDLGTVLDLILAEFRLRSCSEANLTVEEYVRRFPQYGDEVSARLKSLPRDE